MQRVTTLSTRALVAALLAVVVSATSIAMFEADQPGHRLTPVGNAADLVRIVQGQNSIMWTSMGGVVESYRVQGWPSSTGDLEMGGGVVIEKLTADAGVIQASNPKSLTFTIRD